MSSNGVKFPETIDEVMRDPSKYGLPTLDQFCANPDAFRLGKEYLFERVDEGSKLLTNGFKRYTFEIAGYVVSTLEEVQAIALNEGFDFKMMDICPMVIPGTFGQERIHVRFEQRNAPIENQNR